MTDDGKPKMMEVLRMLEDEEKEKLEIDYGVLLNRNILVLTCNIVKRFFDGNGNDSREEALRKAGVELLREACARFREELDTNTENLEMELNKLEYGLCRMLVGLHEITKEKNDNRELWLARLKSELKDLKSKFESFESKWTPLLFSASSRMSEQTGRVREVREQLFSCLQETEASDAIHRDPALQLIDTTVTELSQGIPQLFREHMTIRPSHIAKIASSLTGVPASWLLRSVKAPLEGLRARLVKRVIGQEQAITVVCNALSRPRPAERSSCPIRSFLFCGSNHGKSELSRALAEQLFDDKDRLIWFDLKEYAESCSLSDPNGIPSSHSEQGVARRIMEAVRKSPFSVLFLENLDMAHQSDVNALIEILGHGMLTDSQGSFVDFTKTLIIMTLDIGMHKALPHSCNCLLKSQDHPFKEQLDLGPWGLIHACTHIRVLLEAQSFLKPELCKLLDDVVIIYSLDLPHSKLVTRFQLRDIASAKIGRGLVLYASEASLNAICTRACVRDGGGKATRIWLEENLVPVLLEIHEKGIKDNSIIYIDTLVGSKELSYRLEDRALDENQMFRQFKEFSGYFRIMYRKEKERIKSIFLLKRKYFELNTTQWNVKTGKDLICIARVIYEVINIMDDLLAIPTDTNIVANEDEEGCALNKEADLTPGERAIERAKKGVQGLKARLCNNLVGKNRALNVVAEVLLRIIDSPSNLHLLPLCIDATDDLPSPVLSFLFLGLKVVGRADFLKDLAEQLFTDDGTGLHIQINLAEYTDPDSLSRLMDGPMRFNGCDHSGVQLLDRVRMRPYSILFFDQVEKAHISVFSALLSILDHGKFGDNQGGTVDFRNSIVIIALNLGNKEIIAQLFGRTLQNSVSDDDIKQGGGCFRTELLNRLDEIVFFNPCVQEQLTRVARLSMRNGKHLGNGGYFGFPGSLVKLFKSADDPEFEKVPAGITCPVLQFFLGLRIDESTN